MSDEFKDKKIVITGGTGSFGSSVVNTLLTEGADNIVIFSRDEKKQDDLRNRLQSNNVNFVIGDTRDPSACTAVMRGADLVFHAAALKQVPFIEDTSNEDIHYTRNYIRHKLMDNALIVNPGLHKTIARKVKDDER